MHRVEFFFNYSSRHVLYLCTICGNRSHVDYNKRPLQKQASFRDFYARTGFTFLKFSDKQKKVLIEHLSGYK